MEDIKDGSRYLQEGTLSQLKDLEYNDLLLMIKMLPSYSDTLMLLLDVFSTPQQMIKFLDLFADVTMRLPSRSRIYHVIHNINVYRYWQSIRVNNPDEDASGQTAKRFRITRQYVDSIVDRVKNAR